MSKSPLFARSAWLLALLLAAACDHPAANPPDASAGPGLDDAAAASPDAGVAPGADAAVEPPDAAVEPADAAAIDPRRYDALAASIRAEMAELGSPGVAVAVVENGQMTFAQGFGLRHPDQADAGMLPTTNFRLASVTKQLTAAAVLQQVALGALDLDKPITDYLPNFALDLETSQQVLVRHLLTHTSGLNDYLEYSNRPDELGDTALERFYTTGRYAGVGYFMAPPGRFYNYSNTGFNVAGLLVEKVTKLRYRPYMMLKIFGPIGMARTFLLPSEVLADGDYATGVSTDQNGQRVLNAPDSYDNTWARPCGYSFSNVVDLSKWARFLMHGDDAILPSAQRLAMQTRQFDMESYLDLFHYDFGLWTQTGLFLETAYVPGTDTVQHDGYLDGFATQIVMVPAQDFAIVVLANKSGAYFSKSIALALDTFVPHGPAGTWPDPQIDPASFNRFVGTYLDPHEVGTMNVTLEGTRLKISMPDLDAYSVPYSHDLVPTSDRNFTLTVQGFPFGATFMLDAAGKPEFLRTRSFVGAYQPPAGPSPLPPRPSLRVRTDRKSFLEQLRRTSLEERLEQHGRTGR
ncbi:MAG TPA: serine hydrolase domain-containing protein [Myxococcales bacterium]|jgi:CubicO group peptidase (beta-lactamase class C family)